MYDVEYNALGWARDKVLTSSINDCLNSTDGDDMIYATLKRYEPSITMAANVNLKGICENENMEIMPLFVHILG